MRMKSSRLAAVVALAAALALVAGCKSATSSTTDNTSDAPTALFSNAAMTYTVSQSPTSEFTMIQDMGNAANTSTTASVSTLPATGTFESYPSYWDGGIAWAMLPTGASGYYDLSGVKTIKFKIKSSTILPTQLALFIQWKSATSGAGNEYTIPLAYSASVTDAALTTSSLGVTGITDWTDVSFDLTTLPDTSVSATDPNTGEPTRYSYTAEHFFSANGGDGSTHVDTPFAIKWYGSADTGSNTGPIAAAGDSYQIGDIQFLSSSGTAVAIYSKIKYTIPTTLAPDPTLSASSVSSPFQQQRDLHRLQRADGPWRLEPELGTGRNDHLCDGGWLVH